MNGISYASQFLAAPLQRIGASQGGMPLPPIAGGYGTVPQFPFMKAETSNITPAGYGPINLGSEGYSRPFVTAAPGRAGRNPYGEGRQGRPNVARVGVQGFDATGVFV